jgi:hypothetical protein
MPYKDVEKSREAIRRHYHKNKAYYLEKNNRRRQELRDYVNQIKSTTPCTDCGTSYPYFVMDFDHLGDKTDMISKLVKLGGSKKLRDEIQKCEVVCANCHRFRSYNRIQAAK